MDREDHPVCSQEPGRCTNDDPDHEGFVHATDVAEVLEAIDRGDTVYDWEGDIILTIRSGRARTWRVTYCTDEESAHNPKVYHIQRIGSILIPEVSPVTEEELAEVYASFGVKP